MGFLPVVSSISLGIPLLILGAVALIWWWASRIAAAPRLVADPPYRSWRANPAAAAYGALREERYLLAAYLLRERLLEVAAARWSLSESDLRHGRRNEELPALPRPLTPARVVRDLLRAYRSAYLAEGLRPSELFAAITVPWRRRRAARDFARAADEVDRLLAAWGTAA